MYSDTIDHFANLARNKADTLSNRPLAFVTGARTACARHPAQLAAVPAPPDGGADTKRRHQGDCYLLVPVRVHREPFKAFRDGERSDPMMTPMARPLTDKDIADLAAYYASLKP